MTRAWLAPVLILVLLLAGCGGGAGTSGKAAGTSPEATTHGETAPAGAVTSCPGGLKTTDTCFFAEQTARAHAANIERFTVAGEPMKCLGTAQHWLCWTTHRKAWVRRP
jgi:hypothetical protein